QIDAGLFVAQVGSATGDLRRYLANRKVAEEMLRLLSSRDRSLPENLQPADTRKPWAFGAAQLRDGFRMTGQRIDHHSAVEVEVAHSLSSSCCNVDQRARTTC